MLVEKLGSRSTVLDDFDTQAHRLLSSFDWAPDWIISVIVLLSALLIAWAVHHIGFRILNRLVVEKDLFWRSLVSRSEGPTRLAIALFGLSVATGIAPLTTNQTALVQHLLLVCLIGLIGWLSGMALQIWSTVYLRRYKLDAADNLLARKHTTQLRILQRVATILIVLVSISAALMTFDDVRQYGVSLLASAGAAGLVVGLALQPLLKNLVAGIQLAITQPIRIEDAIIVSGEWGNVEEITATYVVVRLWDWRRMVVPLSYFMENPFQNWTREDAALIGTVMFYADYTAPIDRMRAKLEEIAAASLLWDRKVVNMQVTDFHEAVMEVRMLISAGTAGRTFDLRCEVREKMIAWLQQDYPNALPRRRMDVEASDFGPDVAGLKRARA
ncbi:MAG TPA: mechanosensitive ion channel family protein [Stellaceae bacterium]|nr:mechanosensitive ion channel family protein [Stellaceae bacterium]